MNDGLMSGKLGLILDHGMTGVWGGLYKSKVDLSGPIELDYVYGCSLENYVPLFM